MFGTPLDYSGFKFTFKLKNIAYKISFHINPFNSLLLGLRIYWYAIEQINQTKPI